MAQTRARRFGHFLDNIGFEHTQQKKVDKAKLTRENFQWFMNKTAQMFEYKGLPPTMPAFALERLLQYTGAAVVWDVPGRYKPNGYGLAFDYFTEVEGAPNLYAFELNLAEAPDPYYDSYQAIITNVGFTPTISETVEINKGVIVLRNDTHMNGIASVHLKYAKLLTEAEISLQSTLVLLRDQMTFICKNARQREAVSAYIEAREAGEYAAILAPELGTPLEAIAHDGRSNAVELAVNGLQAIKAAWYNEIGLNPSFSLKREYTSAQEIDTNTDLLIPIIDDMFNNRKRGIDAVNRMFGTAITVDRSSAWKIKREEIETALEVEKNEAESSVYTEQTNGGEQDGGPAESDD